MALYIKGIFLLMIYAAGISFYLLDSPPSKSELKYFDVSKSKIILEGEGTSQLRIILNENLSLRSIAVEPATTNKLKTAFSSHPTTVIVYGIPNKMYIGWLWGSHKQDYSIVELIIGDQKVMSYDDYLVKLNNKKKESIIFILIFTGFIILIYIKRSKGTALTNTC